MCDDRVPDWETGLTEVGPNIFAYLQYDGSWGLSNAGAFVSDDGILAVDALQVAIVAERFIEQLRRVSSQPFRHLVNTHSHPDHVGGNRLFGAAEIVAHVACREEMEEFARLNEGPPSGDDNPFKGLDFTPAMSRMMEQMRDDVGRVVPLPTLVFEDRLTLHYGDTAIELYNWGPAHTRGDVVVYLPHARTLFAGDLAFFRGTPLCAAHMGGWLNVIDKIDELDPEVIVPGHGPTGGKKEMNDIREYLSFVMEQSREAFDAGVSIEEAARSIDLGPFGEWTDPERIIINVRRCYAELAGAAS